MKIEIYSKSTCPYCYRAKDLLVKKKLEFTEYDLLDNPELRTEMIERSGGLSTVPQIFINDKYLSDCDGLYALEQNGTLDSIIEKK
jgi:glutaredoxin 3|tara:strand:- start:571 stop:828 length:258 start_codon:yes stop_codon:yes gene_type:complete